MFRLGELRAVLWLAKGEQERDRYGFKDDGYKMTIELKNNDKTNVLTLEFGGQAPPAREGQAREPYALASVDGQTWIFEFPFGLFIQVLRDFGNPVQRTSSAGP